jgi:hypothetical protein
MLIEGGGLVRNRRGGGERERCNVPPPVIIATNGAEGAIVMDGFGGCESRWVGRKWRKRARGHFT